jgi:hypothetical protein
VEEQHDPLANILEIGRRRKTMYGGLLTTSVPGTFEVRIKNPLSLPIPPFVGTHYHTVPEIVGS